MTTQSSSWSRRDFLKASLASGVSLSIGQHASGAEEESLPPIRVITRGPKHHWFGYYDKLEFDPTGRFVLGMEVDFEHRSPKATDSIAVGMVDLQEGNRWIPLGQSIAWCWQQGCMLQWIPKRPTEVIWNDRVDDHYVSRILDVKTRRLRTIQHPIYALSPDGRTAISTCFSRLGDVRPGYGYVGVPDPYAHELAPNRSGLYRVDLESGTQAMLFSFAEIAGLGPEKATMEGAKHKFNHLLFNQDGSRFIFLHRWKGPKGRETRMLTAAADGSELRIVDDNGLTSHFIWRDPRHILAFSEQPSHGKGFYLFEDRKDGKPQIVGHGVMTRDGHCTYLPGNSWILNDSYPDKKRMQNPYLYEVASGRTKPLGHFLSPPEYTGEWRCDTHPRFSPDGRSVVIDSPTPDAGRQLHLIDISKIVS
jgi:hypothetical protein